MWWLAQAVLLFGSKKWVMTSWLDKSLERFQHWAARRMACMVPKLQWEGVWVYPLIGAVLAMVGLK